MSPRTHRQEKSLQSIIQAASQEDHKPRRFGLNQLKDNIQDPVKLAVKEVLKAQREIKVNVTSPGPGHYVSLNPAPDKKNFAVQHGQFISR